MEGVDSSLDMLNRCRRHAHLRQLDVVLYHGDIAPLALGRRFGALVCPAGSFTLVVDEDRARAALASYLEHLEPGGHLAISMYAPEPPGGPPFTWTLRRTGTGDDGQTYVVHEAVGDDVSPQVQLVYNRLESYDDDGRLLGSVIRKSRLRWWHREQLSAALADAGFVDVEAVGGERAWITIGRRLG